MTLDAPVADWVASRLGSAPEGEFFEASSMSEVWGVRLADGRSVAVKRRGGGARLAIACAAHRAAAAAGIDTPALLAGPDALGGERGGADDAWLTAEDWRPEGAFSPEGDAPVLFAGLLASLVRALADVDAAGLTPPPWLWYDHDDEDRVWPPAASDRWDPHRIEADLPPALAAMARAARARLRASALSSVLGHSDLNALNVRWVGDRPIVHDWDSVAVRPEAVLAGTLALDHPAAPDAGAAADVATGARVIKAYEDARGRAFTADEREVAWATSVWLACYNAAFEHLHGGPGTVTAVILRDGEERLALAGA
ncbi:phosphotransferase [Demequina mangrovi]|uniref:Phosphotransferase enzyme family protein n=1 Tax=Demequina mangrovi TaxID=1043493 RepID=A0A1H6YWS5_9MICO|nr:phosphotransferase [Demequina mangrovi]SEJ45621.1 Phosphotransferase enzyme family protein [Demequina mangrovi]